MDTSTNFTVTSSSTSDSQTDISDEKISNNVYASVKEVHRCPYKDCNFSSTWKASLNNHIKTHTGQYCKNLF